MTPLSRHLLRKSLPLALSILICVGWMSQSWLAPHQGLVHAAPLINPLVVVNMPLTQNAGLIYEAQPTTSYYSQTHQLGLLPFGTYRLGGGGMKYERSLLQYDLSTIPANATVLSATLSVEVTAWPSRLNIGPSGRIGVYRLGGSWSQAVTWQTQPVVDSNLIAARVLQTSVPGPYTWDILPLVTNWLSTPASNYGLLLTSAPQPTTDIFWAGAASSMAGTGTPPRLQIVYALPSTPTASPSFTASPVPSFTATVPTATASPVPSPTASLAPSSTATTIPTSPSPSLTPARTSMPTSSQIPSATLAPLTPTSVAPTMVPTPQPTQPPGSEPLADLEVRLEPSILEGEAQMLVPLRLSIINPSSTEVQNGLLRLDVPASLMLMDARFEPAASGWVRHLDTNQIEIVIGPNGIIAPNSEIHLSLLWQLVLSTDQRGLTGEVQFSSAQRAVQIALPSIAVRLVVPSSPSALPQATAEPRPSIVPTLAAPPPVPPSTLPISLPNTGRPTPWPLSLVLITAVILLGAFFRWFATLRKV